jgi:hypothetical protein
MIQRDPEESKVPKWVDWLIQFLIGVAVWLVTSGLAQLLHLD